MTKSSDKETLRSLYARPGFLLRRANQIAAALFLDAVADHQVTTTQFGALMVLRAEGPMDQAALARLLRLDRSTTGLVIANLERRGAICRSGDPKDRRRRMLSMTDAGTALLDKVIVAAEGVPAIELSPFTAEEAREFLRLLEKFVEAFDADAEYSSRDSD